MATVTHAPVRAYIGLGSNLADPIAQVRRALQELAGLPDTRCLSQSGLYRSQPLGPANQPDYINAVAVMETRLGPRDLLTHLQALEAAHGRVRGAQRWGPRTLDLDLLIYDELCMNEPSLTLPHPGIPERSFVLYPLLEVAPGLRLPRGEAVADLARRCSAAGLVRLDEA